MSATFWIIHRETGSRALVEFGLINRKVKLTAFFLTRGNVVDINAVRYCMRAARAQLLG